MSLATSPRESLAATPDWLDRNLYPFQSRYLRSQAGALHYIDEGQGQPILFVHGTPSWSFEWRHAVATLRTQARCVALDHLGFGLSDKPRHALYKPAHHAERLVSFVQELNLRDITLVVHDFGGPIGLSLAAQLPARIRALVIVNTWAWSNVHDRRVSRLSRLIASPIGRFLYMGLNASPRWLLPACFGSSAALSRPVHKHYLGPFRRLGERRAPWVLGCELAGSNAFYEALWQRRGAFDKLPSSIVWGEQDPAFQQDAMRRWQEALPQARLFRLPNVGHFPQEEAPNDLVQAIRALL